MEEKIRLLDIDSRSWEHPADRAALSALKQLPGLDQVVKQLIGLTTEKSLRLISMASAARASDRQFSRVYRLLQDACYLLDWSEKPEVYVAQSPIMNAGAAGVEHPFITINSALVDSLDDAELLAVISHELSHIMSGHVLYKTLLWLLINASQAALQVPLTGVALQGLIGALREWDRKSELSADRASLLSVQDERPMYSLLMKVAGGTEGELVLEEFLAQAAEYEEGGTVVDSVHKLLNVLGKSHPFPVIRLKELKVWRDSGAYQEILAGSYRRRSEKNDPKLEFEDAFASYKEELSHTKDPLGQTLNKLGSMLQDAGKVAGAQAEEVLKSVFGGAPFGGAQKGGTSDTDTDTAGSDKDEKA
jgi:Zn-dependent protease with chaperone function